MILDLDINPKEIGETLSRAVSKSFAAAAEEALRYGSLGRAVKESTDKTATSLVAAVLADPGFRADAQKALAVGILRGIESRGERIAKGMPLQQALALAGVDPRNAQERP